MKDGPNIARVAALVGERARADILTALVAGKALTATELAAEASVTKQTASAHLAKLVDANLVAVQSQGRHRYFQLAAPDVAQLLETLMGVAYRTGALRVRPGPREPALRRARVCYDHLAGEMGVSVFDALLRGKLLRNGGAEVELTPKGRRFFEAFGIDLEAAAGSRRPLCKTCLDWSVRRHHLAGGLGAALLARCFELGWAKRAEGSRVVQLSPRGEKALRERFGLED
jgi:DNA-binding transcriptional ArsR family regulator